MLLNLLAVGDVVGEGGLDFLTRHLRQVQKLKNVQFTVVNGENSSGVGIHPRQADAIFAAGADVITLGNHTWNRLQIADYLEENRYILRPANYTRNVPGRGYGVFDAPGGLRIGVLNLIGRCEMDSNFDNPFTIADGILAHSDADLVVVDFHAEATSEKGALGYYLDGRAQALWGTHTHVPTADCKVLPRGCGFVTDLGMTGPAESVLGIRPQQAINRFLGGLPARYEPADGHCKLEAVLFTLDTEKKRCVALERVDIEE
ncbi:MAG: TIGR00282 family metallophosphoesterase [Oscillospiraceae bacterium]